jgi:hypothetical protein
MQVMSNGRVRRSEDEWRRILSEWETSGLSARDFCRKQELQVSSFQRWRQKLNGSPARDEFVAIPTPAPPVSTWTLEVTLPNGSRLQFQG